MQWLWPQYIWCPCWQNPNSTMNAIERNTFTDSPGGIWNTAFLPMQSKFTEAKSRRPQCNLTWIQIWRYGLWISRTFPEFLILPTIDVNVINFLEFDHQWINLYYELEFSEHFRTEEKPEVIMMGARSSLLTSKSPSGMPSKREGLIHFSITSHPPRFTALTLRLSRRCLRGCKAATPPGITKVPETASSPSLPSKYWVWWCTCNSSKPEYTDL